MKNSPCYLVINRLKIMADIAEFRAQLAQRFDAIHHYRNSEPVSQQEKITVSELALAVQQLAALEAEIREALAQCHFEQQYNIMPDLEIVLERCHESVETLSTNMTAFEQLVADITQITDAIKDAECQYQANQTQFVLSEYAVHVPFPYGSLVAFTAAMLLTTVSLGLLAGSPLFAFMIAPVLANHITILSATGAVIGIGVGIKTGIDLTRYVFFSQPQEMQPEVLASNISLGCC
jgi:hypothetical protein